MANNYSGQGEADGNELFDGDGVLTDYGDGYFAGRFMARVPELNRRLKGLENAQKKIAVKEMTDLEFII